MLSQQEPPHCDKDELSIYTSAWYQKARYKVLDGMDQNELVH